MLQLIGFLAVVYLGWASGIIPWMFLVTADVLTWLAYL
jgi:hypothetical protein